MVAQTNQQTTKYATKKNDTVICLRMGKNRHGKNPTEWFSGHYSWNSTIITISGYKERNPSILYQPTVEPLP